MNETIPCVVFEDDHLLIVNKPAGLNTHSPSPFAGEGIYDWLRHREPRWSDLAIIHRLDKETSGVLVFGKTRLANRSLTDQFSRRSIFKTYAFISGNRVQTIELRIVSAIVRSGERYESRPVHQGNASAETRFRIAELTPEGTLIEATPVTGRTHQIRVHAAALGVPILGDTLYGGRPAHRLYLHACSISFRHPDTGEEMRFESIPDFESDPRAALRMALIDPERTNAFRLTHGASDGCPGWYVDRVGDFILSQSARQQPSAAEMEELSRLKASMRCRGVYHRRLERRIQKIDSATASPELMLGDPAPDRHSIVENGVRYEIRFREGYSTGLFLDQRDNRRRILVNHIAASFPLFETSANRKDVLNVFAYTCAFSVCAAMSGACTTSLDLSKKYLDWGRRNFLKNGIDPDGHDFIYGDAFDWLQRLAKKGRLFDLIILDPPTFSRSKQRGVFRAESDYSELIRVALPLLKPAGVILAGCNDSGWKPGDFVDAILGAVQETGRVVLKHHFVPQSPDFTISRAEPGYLKTVWMRVGT